MLPPNTKWQKFSSWKVIRTHPREHSSDHGSEDMPSYKFADFNDLPGELRNKVYSYALPDFVEIQPERGTFQEISANELKPYFYQYGQIFCLNRQFREEALTHFFARHNARVDIGWYDTPDRRLVELVGLRRFETVIITFPLTDVFPLSWLMNMLGCADRLKYLSFQIIANHRLRDVPVPDMTHKDLDKFASYFGGQLLQNLQQLKQIDICFPNEVDVLRPQVVISSFLEAARLNLPSPSATIFEKIILRALNLGHPYVQLESMEEWESFGLWWINWST